ncbi:hypothetical protein Tco_0665628 [Tanacetum coccineum]
MAPNTVGFLALSGFSFLGMPIQLCCKFPGVIVESCASKAFGCMVELQVVLSSGHVTRILSSYNVYGSSKSIPSPSPLIIILTILILARNLSALPNKLSFPLEVEIADSKVVVVNNVYNDMEIEIDDSIFKINLIPIMLGVVKPQGHKIIIYGDKRKGDFKLCYVMKARKYWSHGCYAFIVHVIDTSFEKKNAKDVSVINEFLDVFLEDLSGIPPKRKVEFRIDLVTSATPIAKLRTV